MSLKEAHSKNKMSLYYTTVYRITGIRGRAQPRTVAVGTDPALQVPVCRTSEADTDRWEVYLRRKIDLFPKTSVYHTLFIWGKKTDARVTVLNT